MHATQRRGCSGPALSPGGERQRGKTRGMESDEVREALVKEQRREIKSLATRISTGDQRSRTWGKKNVGKGPRDDL